MEGVSGIVKPEQTSGGDPMYEEGRKLYTQEINAAVRGAKAAGATEVVVMDCHGAGKGWTFNSLVPELLLEELRVARPLLLHDPLAVLVQQLRHERVEGPAAARAVAVHHDDLGRASRLRAAYGRVDLLGVELAALLVHRVAAARLLRLDDP